MDRCRRLREGERKSERAEKEERSGPSGGIDTEMVLERERERKLAKAHEEKEEAYPVGIGREMTARERKRYARERG